MPGSRWEAVSRLVKKKPLDAIKASLELKAEETHLQSHVTQARIRRRTCRLLPVIKATVSAYQTISFKL